jgi:hypothetical protein
MMSKIRVKHAFPKAQYIVAVTRGTKTRYFYGEKLKDALRTAGLKPEEYFSYARFPRDGAPVAALNHGETYSTY